MDHKSLLFHRAPNILTNPVPKWNTMPHEWDPVPTYGANIFVIMRTL